MKKKKRLQPSTSLTVRRQRIKFCSTSLSLSSGCCRFVIRKTKSIPAEDWWKRKDTKQFGLYLNAPPKPANKFNEQIFYLHRTVNGRIGSHRGECVSANKMRTRALNIKVHESGKIHLVTNFPFELIVCLCVCVSSTDDVLLFVRVNALPNVHEHDIWVKRIWCWIEWMNTQNDKSIFRNACAVRGEGEESRKDEQIFSHLIGQLEMVLSFYSFYYDMWRNLTMAANSYR